MSYITDADDAYMNYVTYNNRSPEPRGAAQRIQRISDFAGALDTREGLPDVAVQQSMVSTADTLSTGLYNQRVQSKILAAMGAAGDQANEVLANPPPPIWPPSTEVQALFDLDGPDINSALKSNNQRIQAYLAFAYTMVRAQLTHTFYLATTGITYDTHTRHDQRQRATSAVVMPELARLLAALKATPSP